MSPGGKAALRSAGCHAIVGLLLLRASAPTPNQPARATPMVIEAIDVVYAPTPSALFNESTGKVELVYPLQKKVDRAIRLMAIH